ncbi:MAG: polysaccharide deacetylase [Ruminococcus sp.]|nr:polysaccharide deacetylase [Ruminococcus sp.]
MKRFFGAALGLFLACQSSVCYGALSTASHGYGQGKERGNDNCPIGATDFSNAYSKYESCALSNDKNRIILTFDQGYENGYTEKILDTLKEKDVQAIFFLTGDYAKKETALVNRMISEGHTLGNHGMTHAKFPELSEDELREEIMSLHNYVLEAYNYEMQYLRPPCGEYSEQTLNITKDLGYKTLMWSFAHVDWQTDMQPPAKESLENMLNCAHGGAIYLLHSVSSTNAEIMGELIDGLREKGYTV